MKKILVIYHQNCPDGIGSAACFHYFSKKLGWPKTQIDYHPAAYISAQVPDVKEYQDVYIVDFSYSLEKTLELKSNISGKLVILDHHKTAIENLESLTKTPKLDLENSSNSLDPNLTIILDINRSGAQITWDYLSGNKPRPWFIDYIGDRDLWTWKLPFSKEINKVLAIEDYLRTDKLFELLNENKIIPKFIESGKCYLKMEKNLVNDIIIKAVKKDFLGYKVTVVPASILISEVGDALVSRGDSDFVIIWRHDPFNVKYPYSYSLRGSGDPDLSAIAKKYGGGGHAPAAGMSTSTFLFS